MQDSLAGAAAEYVGRFFLPVFPLLPRSKEPATTHGVKDATMDAPGIGEWWAAHPEDNVGVALGDAAGGVFAIDLDVHEDADKDGYTFLREWERDNGALPETASAITGSGGCHLLYRSREQVRCSVNRELGVDVRGEGGYVVAPPSVHPNGRRYEWEVPPDEVPIAWADANVMAFVEAVRPKGRGMGERFELPESIGAGQRNDTLFKYASSLQARGYEDSEIYDLVALKNSKLCSPPLPDAEVVKIVESATAYDKGERRDAATRVCEGDKAAMVLDVASMLDRRGKYPSSTTHNYAVVLTEDERFAGRLWYDCGSYAKMVNLPLPWDAGEGARQVRDSDYAALDRIVSHEYGFSGRQALVDAVTAVCMETSVDPFCELLRTFRWDGTERLGTMMRDLFGTQDSAYNAEFGTLLVRSIVTRAFEPGCKLDYMFIVSGPQGCRKSSGVRALALQQRWFCESLTEFEGDSTVEKLRGVHVVEVPELSAFKRTKEVEQIKTFITQRVDTIRPKYARETEQRPRSCVLMGTTNAGGFLSDATGNRRFLIAEAGFQVPPRYDSAKETPELREYVEQLYAEAVAWYDGAREHDLVFPEELLELAEGYREIHVEDDPRVGMVAAYLDGVRGDPLRQCKYVCLGEVCEKALQMDRRDWYGKRAVLNQITEIMRNMPGWVACGRKYCGEWGRQRAYEPVGQTE